MSDKTKLVKRLEKLLPTALADQVAEEVVDSLWLAEHDEEVRAGVVPEGTEWEYGWKSHFPNGEEYEWLACDSREHAEQQIRSYQSVEQVSGYEDDEHLTYSLWRRTKSKAGEWVPVKQEGAEPSGRLVAGLPQTGGDADSERDDADQSEPDAEPVHERVIHPPRDDEDEQEQGAEEQVPVELHTDDSTPAPRHTGMKQEGAKT